MDFFHGCSILPYNLHNVLASSKLNFGECWGWPAACECLRLWVACGLWLFHRAGLLMACRPVNEARAAVNGLRPGGKTRNSRCKPRPSGEDTEGICHPCHYATFKYPFSERCHRSISECSEQSFSERSERSKKRVKRAVYQ